MQGYHQSSDSSTHRGTPLTYAPLGLQHHAPMRCSPRTPVLVSPGTPTRRPDPPGGPMLLCAIVPCSLFRHTMTTLVVPFVYILRVPSGGGCLRCQCASVYQRPDLLFPPNALRPQATRSFLATAYHVRPLNAVPGHPLSCPRHRSRRRHLSGAVPHVSDENRPVRRC